MPAQTKTVTVVTRELQTEGTAILVRRRFRADNVSLVEGDGSLGRLVVRASRTAVAVFHDWSHAYLQDELLEEQQEELQAAMDRNRQLLETISNLEKKLADAQAALVANEK
jgi:uncharacterized protein YlxW (UPF0749 family)